MIDNEQRLLEIRAAVDAFNRQTSAILLHGEEMYGEGFGPDRKLLEALSVSGGSYDFLAYELDYYPKEYEPLSDSDSATDY